MSAESALLRPTRGAEVIVPRIVQISVDGIRHDGSVDLDSYFGWQVEEGSTTSLRMAMVDASAHRVRWRKEYQFACNRIRSELV
jgi:hypothetical protein